MANAKLEISMKLTLSDGTVKSISTDFEFSTDEEATDHYWANLKGAALGSEDQERTNRGKKAGKK